MPENNELENIVPNGLSENTADSIAKPIPMSFPAVLRHPKLADRFAHLRIAEASAEATPTAATVRSEKNTKEDREGKRWVRRKENARFAGNPHIVAATKGDYSLALPNVKSTFPEPLPAYLPRNVPVSSISSPPAQSYSSSNAGRFSLSLKGMRRELRKFGSRAQYLVRDVESEILTWLQDGGVVLFPDGADNAPIFPGLPIGDTGTIREVRRTPLQLVWYITDDAFARYIVHCCARYHEVVSFSRDVAGQRLTFLLRPNVTRPDHLAPALLDTPPATDYSSQGDAESESDFTSDREILDSSVRDQRPRSALSAISETNPSNHIYRYRATFTSQSEDEWSILGDDVEEDAEWSGSEYGFTSPMSTQEESEAVEEQTPRANLDLRASLRHTRRSIGQSAFSRVWDRRNRANSSPSRSPARPSHRRVVTRRINLLRSRTSRTLYEYLFSDRAG